MTAWYKKPIAQIIQELKTNSTQGLSNQEATARIQAFGHNTMQTKERTSFIWLFILQFKNIFLAILLCAGIVKIAINEYTDATLVFGITLVSALIGTIQEFRAQKMAHAIKKLLPKSTLVLREGRQISIPSDDLVPGDIVILLDGSLVPADGILISNYGLQVNESLLTGESLPVVKEFIVNGLAEDLPSFDRKNMVYSGSLIAAGTAHMVVVTTGMDTLVGKLAKSIQETRQKPSHLQNDLNRLSQKLLAILIGSLLCLVIIGIIQGYPIKELIFALLSLLVSVVPEGLPLVFAIMLARAAYELALRHKVLIKNPRSAEVLGEMETLIMDKTGTLTQNMPKVITCHTPHATVSWQQGCYQDQQSHKCVSQSIVEDQQNPLWLIGLTGALLNESEEIEEQGKIVSKGEPLLIAFGKFAVHLGFEKEMTQQKHPKFDEVPFSSQTRLRYTAYALDTSKQLCIISGAPEEVFNRLTGDQAKELALLKTLLAQGQRTIALGYALKQKNDSLPISQITYQFLALIGIEDAIRPEAPRVIKEIQDLGIEILIATGDHAATTCSISQQVAISCTSEQHNASNKNVRQKLTEGNHVFARITPQEKLELVEALHKIDKNKTVGMIGDGVNDVPALHAADVGISFGSSGTDTAREASDVLLMEDTISALAPAIIWGRHVRNAVQRVIYFLLTTSVSEICIILFGLALGLPVPLLANQILWLHVITDGFLDFAISMEPMAEQILTKPSAHSLFAEISAKKIITTGVLVSFCTLIMFTWSLDVDVTYARTMGFTTLTLFQWAIAWNFRSLKIAPYKLGYHTNRWLLGMTLAVFIGHCIALYVPLFQTLLYFTPLSLHDWLWCALLPGLLFLITQSHAWFKPQKKAL
ncbi:MAG: Calcium-translocating P-type ATPase, PMCA-type [candidate division TM6 bacterium GW2011_GWF2_43_17]|nr:MAG: Calcium-translocating P-type ATPase, PMCA-type [candidate division TM6 bacterium GW2011_GWF2_43_17]